MLTLNFVFNTFRMLLLNKLLEDGNVLYRKGQLKDAVYRYQYALRKIPVNEYDEGMQAAFDEMKMTFMLQLSRCKQKMNVSLVHAPQK